MKLPNDSTSVIELSECYIWKDEDGIICGFAKDKSQQKYEDAVEIMDTILNLANGEKAGFLFDLTGILSQEKRARDYYSSSRFDGKFFAIAIVVRSVTARVIANFYMGLNKPRNPTRVFNTAESAKQWINSLR